MCFYVHLGRIFSNIGALDPPSSSFIPRIDSISIRPTNMFGLVWEDVLTSLRTNFQCKGFVMFCCIVFTPWISLDTVFLEKGHHGDSPSPARRGLAGEASCTMLYMGPICSNLRYIYSTWRFCCFDLWSFSNHGQVLFPVISRIPFRQGALHASPAMLEEVQNILNKV